MFREARDLSGVAIALQQLARGAFHRDDVDGACSRLAKALVLHKGVLDRRGLVLVLESAAFFVSRNGDHTSAATLLGAADRFRGQMLPLQPPSDRDEIDSIRKAARHVLGDAAYDGARLAGSTFSRDDAISLALSVLEAPPTAETVLTKREMEVLRLVVQGASNQEIADTLYISLRTVKAHMTNIFTKLDLTSRSAAVAYAYQHNLV